MMSRVLVHQGSRLIKQDTFYEERAMGQIRIVAKGNYAGEGISQGLARGLQVYYRDCNLTDEGLSLIHISEPTRPY